MIRHILRLPPSDRALVMRAGVLVTLIRLALWTLPFAVVQKRIGQAHGPSMLAAGADIPVDRLVWAVRAASRRIPRATCLTQALCLQFLLARSGRTATLRVGVTAGAERGFSAHAWIESEGRTLLDRPETVGAYAPLASWKSL